MGVGRSIPIARALFLVLLALELMGCDRLLPYSSARATSDRGDADQGDARPVDRRLPDRAGREVQSPPDAGPCGAWSPAARLPGPVNTLDVEWSPSISQDGKTLYFARHTPSRREETIKVWSATRAAPADPFGAPSPVDALDLGYNDPEISADGLEIFAFRADAERLFRATRTAPGAPFDAPVIMPLGPQSPQRGPSLSGDGLELYYGLVVPGTSWQQSNLAWARRPSKGDAFTDQGELVALNAPGKTNDWPSISADGRELYFSSDRNGAEQIFVATRVSPGAPFGTPVAVPLDVQGHGVSDPEISADGRTLYVSVNESGDTNLWYATRTCP